MCKFRSLLLNFGEAVLAKESGDQEGKLGLSVGPRYLDEQIDKDKRTPCQHKN